MLKLIELKVWHLVMNFGYDIDNHMAECAIVDKANSYTAIKYCRFLFYSFQRAH